MADKIASTYLMSICGHDERKELAELVWQSLIGLIWLS